MNIIEKSFSNITPPPDPDNRHIPDVELNIQTPTMFPTRIRRSVLKRSSYYRSDYRQGDALIRARSPYLVRNAITGISICAFTVGVYAYTIYAIKSDEFEEAAWDQSSRSEAKK